VAGGGGDLKAASRAVLRPLTRRQPRQQQRLGPQLRLPSTRQRIPAPLDRADQQTGEDHHDGRRDRPPATTDMAAGA
jgi:hypothetical protein